MEVGQSCLSQQLEATLLACAGFPGWAPGQVGGGGMGGGSPTGALCEARVCGQGAEGQVGWSHGAKSGEGTLSWGWGALGGLWVRRSAQSPRGLACGVS